MKHILVVAMLVFIVTGCRQKEEPRPQSPFPAGPVQTLETLKMAQEAVKNDPSNVNAWIQLGNVSMDSSRFDEAINAYQRALSIDPNNVNVRVDMGTCYRNIGKPDIAAKEYRKALSIDPNHPNGHKNLGVVLAFDLRDNVQAAKEFERYVQLVPNAPDAERVKEEIRRLRALK